MEDGRKQRKKKQKKQTLTVHFGSISPFCSSPLSLNRTTLSAFVMHGL